MYAIAIHGGAGLTGCTGSTPGASWSAFVARRPARSVRMSPPSGSRRISRIRSRSPSASHEPPRRMSWTYVKGDVKSVINMLTASKGALEGSGDGPESGQRGGQAGAQEAIIGSREEQGEAEPEVGHPIAEAVGRAFDQVMQAKPAQLISHRALGDRRGIAA